MKALKYLLLLIVSISYLNCSQQKNPTNNFTLKGTIAGKHGPVIWLRYPDTNGKIIQQKAVINNGTFIFKGTLSSPVNAEFSDQFYPNITYIRNFYSTTFLSPGDMTVVLGDNTLDVRKLTGSVMQDDWSKLDRKKKQLYKLQDSISNEIFKIQRNGNTPKNHAIVETLSQKIHVIVNKKKQIEYDFIQLNPNSYLSPYITQYYFSGMRELQLDSAEKFYDSFATYVKNSVAGKSLKREITKRKSSAVGSVAPLFIRHDINNNVIDLKSFRNKNYVLLNFWASFNEPNPYLKKVYDKYHLNDLTIIGLSFDASKNDWKDAIKKYGYEKWINILLDIDTLKDSYDIESTPPSFIFLIDKQGKIIGRYFHGATYDTNGDNEGTMSNLEQKLKETFGY